MSTRKLLIATFTYVIGLLIVLTTLFRSPTSYVNISLGVLFIVIAWTICLLDTTRQKPFNPLWFWFIFFIGAVGIPAYLLSVVEWRKKEENGNLV